MDIPRGHAAMPLTEADFLDFIYNYFKAEYAPIRSFWSTATADPRQLPRWINMGHEMSPLTVRPANAQAQKDLESLDYFTRKWNLDASFIRGLVIRFAKYEVHDRLEKKLFECARLDLMVRKALKEKHLIDALWPSPAPRNLPHELLAQGVAIRKFYGDMFNKYFRVLHSIDEFELRPEVDMRIKNSGTLMLVPFVDHLIFGAVDPIMPIVAKGAGYSNAKGWRASGSSKSDGFGEPGRFEIRFDAPADVQETYTKTIHDRAKTAQPTRLAFPLCIEPAAITTRKQEPGDSKTRGTKQTQSELDGYSPSSPSPSNSSRNTTRSCRRRRAWIGRRPAPAGLPSNLMDDFVPVSPAYVPEVEEGWGRDEVKEESDDDDEEEEEYEGRSSGGLVDLDAVAREEADVWGEREE
ncbi:hypothetical protein SNOG_12699 [Parastagonospora nodorum SN15]|uniref:Uncharacterized protein n=1 Tax=Phaeosphaeria nodorum (strain SN15 / ATCC MYA-4574 / FGSC 10173) TaxID=321614 RepID=Q0U6B5_PHANO|nr:hypothetical protein SNOG_12699 [Parastagonospora nodorum SN15]EAT79997.2 hypothetical protein SNOG_12699 [Parastagonospora nodorum SN15]